MAENLFERLKTMQRLPSPPSIALRVLELVKSEDVTFNELAKTISSDPALSLKVLKFVNSSAAGVGRPVSSLYQAVPLIGLRGIKLMALSFSLLTNDKRAACAGFDFERFWSQSLACGVAARALAQATRRHDPDEAFMGGILARIGQLAMVCGVPNEYAAVMQSSKRTGRDLRAVEQEVFGTTHTALAGAVLTDWHLPEALCTAVANYRDRTACPPEPSTETASPGASGFCTPLAMILHVSDLIARLICDHTEHDAGQVDYVSATLRELLPIQGEQWEQLFAKIVSDWQAFGAILSIQTGEVKPFTEILSEAQERMTELSMATHLENQQIQETNNELKSRVLLDKLTGIHNRAAFDERWPVEMERAIRATRPLAVLVIDVDHFKRFNDAHGHQAGDAVLATVASTLTDAARKVDFIARYGGEEFVVIAPETNVEQATVLAERLRAAVAGLRIEWEGQGLSVTVSVGGAACTRALLRSAVQDLIRCADEQLYAAKRAGRNRCQLINPGAPAAGAARGNPRSESRLAEPVAR